MTVVIGRRYDCVMQANDDSLDATAKRWRSPARARMVDSAATLIRERGIHGVGLREVVTHSGGPRGSLQRYFPGGKTQLITEALNLAAAEVLDDTESKLIEAANLADAIDAIFAPWRQLLIDSNFTLGCPVAATVVDASGDDQLRQEARALLAQMQGAVRDALVRFDVPKSTADDDASVLVAALEGALILSRADGSAQALDTVERFFTKSLTEAAGK